MDTIYHIDIEETKYSVSHEPQGHNRVLKILHEGNSTTEVNNVDLMDLIFIKFQSLQI